MGRESARYGQDYPYPPIASLWALLNTSFCLIWPGFPVIYHCVSPNTYVTIGCCNPSVSRKLAKILFSFPLNCLVLSLTVQVMSFYPPGWDYDRVLNATDEEIMSLTDEQHTRLFDGLREAGLFGYVMEVAERRDQEARAAAEAQKPEDEKLAEREILSPYLDSLKNVFKFSDEWSEWGFVIFRTCSYGPAHEAQWVKFRGRWDQIMDEEIAEYHNYHPKLDRAIELRKFHWVEDPALEGASPYDISR